MAQNLLSASIVIGALRVKHWLGANSTRIAMHVPICIVFFYDLNDGLCLLAA